MTVQRTILGSSGREVTEAAVQRFETRLGGRLLRPGDAGYDDTRKVWNGMIDKRPGLIARCVGVSDVISAVEFAREHGLLVSVRGGGHNVSGAAVCEGGLMIDLSLMKGARVDPRGGTALAQPGLTWGEFDREAQAFGMATTGGTVSDTGIAGLTLGGGIGWLGRKHGLTCDNLLSADLVTADGSFVTASHTENEDLFWGLRGGGGNFGIVTSFEYRVHPVGPFTAGRVFYPFDEARKTLQFYREFSLAIPREMNTIGGVRTGPDGLPDISVGVCYNGPRDAAERALAPLREFGPKEDGVGPKEYWQIQSMIDYAAPPGLHYYQKSCFLESISDELIDVILDHFARVTSPRSGVFFQQMGGAMREGGPEAGAFTHRGAEYDLIVSSAWDGSGDGEAHVEWARDLTRAVQPFSTGGIYINGHSPEAGGPADQVRAAYGASYDRLVTLKDKYDPTNFFRQNLNIPPTGSGLQSAIGR